MSAVISEIDECLLKEYSLFFVAFFGLTTRLVKS